MNYTPVDTTNDGCIIFRVSGDVSEMLNLTEEMFEELKSSLFMHGKEALEDFSGIDLSGYEDKDVIDNLLDEIASQMPEEEQVKYYRQYCRCNDAPNLAVNSKVSKECLEKYWANSAYNEDTEEELTHYMKPDAKTGDIAYLHRKEDDSIQKMKIIRIIRKSEDPFVYNHLIQHEDILLEGEDAYDADTSAEFILDHDCFLVWFEYTFNLTSDQTILTS